MDQEKRRPRLWLAIAVIAFSAVAVWMIVGLISRPDPGNVSDPVTTVVQPSSLPPAGEGAVAATPDNSGRDATGDAVSRSPNAADRRPNAPR